MPANRSLSLKIYSSELTFEIIKDIEEYAIGFFYIFIKTKDNVIAIDRDTIYKVYKIKKERWFPIKLKKIPKV